MSRLLADGGPSGALSDASPSSGLYCCLLDAQPDYLVPERSLEAIDELGPLFINAAATQVSALGDAFWDGAPVVSVPHAIRGTMNPFWIGPELRRVLGDVTAGDAFTRGCSAQQRRALWHAGILVSPDAEAARRADSTATIARAAQEFAVARYTSVPGLIHPFHIGALRTHYRRALRTGGFNLGDKQTPRRYRAHNEGVARFFHHQLTPLVASIVGSPVKPSYAYSASYQSGAELPRHVDRAQCEYSISILIDFTPEPDSVSPWPLHLDLGDSGGVAAIHQAFGEGLVYRGRELPHHRARLAAGSSSTSIFLHYVDVDFSGPLD